jgi:hypothetical protein
MIKPFLFTQRKYYRITHKRFRFISRINRLNANPGKQKVRSYIYLRERLHNFYIQKDNLKLFICNFKNTSTSYYPTSRENKRSNSPLQF